MAYPIQDYNSGDCPASHPVHLVSLFYEFVPWPVIMHSGLAALFRRLLNATTFRFIYSIQKYDLDAGRLVFANGDLTGLSMHGDFTNGWAAGPDSLLQQVSKHTSLSVATPS